MDHQPCDPGFDRQPFCVTVKILQKVNLCVICCLIFGFMALCGLMYLLMVAAFNVGLFRLSRKKQIKVYDPPATYISIVVPARNEEMLIRDCLEDLFSQDYPEDLFEIIVVDDHSSDETPAIVKNFAANHPGSSVSLIELDKSPSGSSKKHALEMACDTARGKLIITTDADCRMGSGWLRTFAAYYEMHHSEMILGPVTFAEGENLFPKIQTLEFLSLIASGAATAELGIPILGNGANMAFTREAFFETGGYCGNTHIKSGDDVFLLLSIRKHYGHNSIAFLWNKDALVRTYPNPTLKSFMEQRLRWVSKSKGYRDFWIISVSLVVFLFNLALITGVLTLFFDWRFIIFTGILWLLKCMFDLPLLVKITSFTKQRNVLKYFPLIQIFYPFYILITSIWAFTGKFSWKGREV
jgi:cellulose synthase/poly-beta-1,6-N-acetylglucosamine synthase-like glycosyltransferase